MRAPRRLLTSAVRAGLGSLLAGAALLAVPFGAAGATDPARAYLPGGAAVHRATPATGRHLSGSIEVGGATRTYRLYVPAHLPSRPVPLLVALHGGLGSGAQFESQTGFDGLAQANGFIVAYPNGTPQRPGTDLDVWNAGGCCGVADVSHENVDDVGFITALIGHLESEYRVDRHRVFLTGHSNGALMAFAVACAASGTIDAIAVQSGALMEPTCDPPEPVSVLEIHGTADENIPINGGRGPKGISGAVFPPPLDALETFATADGCAAPTTRPDPSNRAVSIETWSGCRRGAIVEWAKVAGANHDWMGHPAPSQTVQRLGPPYLGFDSSLAVWSFLAAHQRR